MIQKNGECQMIENRIIPRHVGIIMDGNGRWAKARGLPRTAGHQAGAQKIRAISAMCAEIGIQVLTLYAFSTENWSRPADEVNRIMALAEQYAETEIPEMQRNGVRLRLMGRREGLPATLVDAMDSAIRLTQDNDRLTLNLALNYGGRREIVDSIKSILETYRQGDVIDDELISRHLYCPDCPDIDLMIRTGGEWRVSNFMLWRAVDTIFSSTPVFWPDFQREDLELAIRIYSNQMSHRIDVA